LGVYVCVGERKSSSNSRVRAKESTQKSKKKEKVCLGAYVCGREKELEQFESTR